ncbi:AraC family transcriptional regulator [Pseudomonas sp. F01002]|uniref:helix-turn-helix domain-containing protein n=1 Tax=Pseudomonas sp. F01002 TaxID=2555724 RepID=UPI001069A0F0|nr:AraC family transcriptional regulator [Pseudomonas sp. F01002]TFB32349.1 AraC family transcriptional regulator [Pseudomonas sp. F01002]
MDENRLNKAPRKDKDFVQFWRIPEGDCELLSARYSTQSFGRHSHDRYAIGVISSGVEKLFYRGSYYMGGAGSVVTITPGEIHDGLPGHDDGWMYRMLYIDPEWVNRMVFQGRFSDDHIHLFQTALSQAPDFARTFLHQHQIIEKSPSSLERETILLDLVTQLFERSGAPIEPVSTAEQHAVQKIKRKLEDEFDQHLSLEELAQLVNLDPLYLIRVFKKSVGVSPHSYQIQKRIAQVQKLLRTGSSLAEASFACGFFDQSHMTRAFKKVVGITPGSFRNSSA